MAGKGFSSTSGLSGFEVSGANSVTDTLTW